MPGLYDPSGAWHVYAVTDDDSLRGIYHPNGGYRVNLVNASDLIDAEFGTQAANKVFAGPSSGADADPTFRALVASDIPSLSATYLPLSGGTLSGRLTSVGITDTGTQLFGDQTPVTALGLTVDQIGIGYAPTNYPAGSTIGVAVAANAPPSSTVGSLS